MDFGLGNGFQRLPPSFACSEYFNGEGGLLDHVVVATGMSEAATSARVTGYRAVLECAPFASSPPPAYNVLSDHCPIVFEITNSDVD